MLAAIALIPSAPILVPELAGAAAAAVADLRSAVLAAAAGLPRRWVAVGAGAADTAIGPAAVGTFAGYGVDVAVALSPEADRAPTGLPLPALITGWLRAQVDPDIVAEVRIFGPQAPETAGRQLRAELDCAPEPVGVLLVADGANTLTASAPGGFDPDTVAPQSALDDALAAGNPAEVLRCAEVAVGRDAYRGLAGLADHPVAARELYRGAPYGVGYFVGVWSR